MISAPLMEFASPASNLTMNIDDPRVISEYHNQGTPSDQTSLPSKWSFLQIARCAFVPPACGVVDQQGAM
jgi:hypothetical protein